MKLMYRIALWISLAAAIGLLLFILLHNEPAWRLLAVIAAVAFSIGIGSVSVLKGYRYTAWIISAVVAGMMYPDAFSHWGAINLRDKWLMLVIVQLVMFGMGIQMSLRDFSGLAQTGKGVAIGLLCHFSIMPLMGWLLTRIFHFEPEIAAGIILIGSCSSGLASNVMVYLARANLVLSVIVTAMATLAAPFFTPLLMRWLAGTLIEVNVISMMMEIIKIVIVPIGAALLHDYLKHATPRGRRIVLYIGLVAVIWLLSLPLGAWNFWKQTIQNVSFLQSIEILGFLFSAVLAGILYHSAWRRNPRIDKVMPYFSMFGIVYFTTVTTAAGHDNLLKVGLLLVAASILHNGAGYFFGYWLSRLFRLDKNSARTIAFEVGLQNGGMASGLAAGMGKLGTVGLPAAVFSPWMNISGSILANFWRKHPAAPVPGEDEFAAEPKKELDT